MEPKEIEIAKKAVGELAASWIQEGMTVGLGTGSTAAAFIRALGERAKAGLKITCAATSERSAQLAQELGLKVVPLNTLESLDVTVDGADEIDPKKRMIKGGGGALLREKVIAALSHEMVVIVDAKKCVEQLGNCKLPIEVVPFAYAPIQKRLLKMGYASELRSDKDAKPYITDNGNYILDLYSKSGFPHPEADNERIRSIPGVLETGLFLGLAGRVIVGQGDGMTQVF